MAFNNSWQRLRENFAEQFEPIGENRYLYRRNQKGEPVPVSAEERTRFIDQYNRNIRYVMWGMMSALFAFIGLILWWTVASRSGSPDVALYTGFGAITFVGIAMLYRVRGAPARELDGRASIGRERSRDEMRAIFFKKISYRQLAGAAAVGVFLVISRAAKEDVFSGWHRLWLGFGAGLLLLAGVQAFRKWRFESENGDSLSS
jgi:hypothetical protein